MKLNRKEKIATLKAWAKARQQHHPRSTSSASTRAWLFGAGSLSDKDAREYMRRLEAATKDGGAGWDGAYPDAEEAHNAR